MSSYRSAKSFAVLSLIALLTVAYCTFPPDYSTDYGNGVVVSADRYVASGDWVFECGTNQLISRTPRQFPATAIRNRQVLKTGKRYLGPYPESQARQLISKLMKASDWPQNFTYNRSRLGEASNIIGHTFSLITEYRGENWVVDIFEPERFRHGWDYQITASPESITPFIAHEQRIREARNSCRLPQ